MRDRPLGAGLQELASNRLKLLWLSCATRLHERWREVLRGRHAGEGPKPPQAAVVKSQKEEGDVGSKAF